MYSGQPHPGVVNRRPAYALACMLCVLILVACGDADRVGSIGGTTVPSLQVALSSSLPALSGEAEALWGSGVEVALSSDQAGLQSLAMGYVDVAVVWGPRPVVGEGLSVQAVASDALAFVVHPLNQTGPLSVADLQRLFSGEVSDWTAFGQSAGAVIPVIREQGAGTRALLEELVLKGAMSASGAPVAACDAAVLDYVATHPGAIGYVASTNLREGVRALTVEEQRPEPQRVRTGVYPLMGGVWFAYRTGGAGEVLLERLLSEEGREGLAAWLASAEWAPR